MEWLKAVDQHVHLEVREIIEVQEKVGRRTIGGYDQNGPAHVSRGHRNIRGVQRG